MLVGQRRTIRQREAKLPISPVVGSGPILDRSRVAADWVAPLGPSQAPQRARACRTSVVEGTNMGKKCPITIGEYEFGTNKNAKEAVKRILNGHQMGYTLTGDEGTFIRDLIALHPATEDKIGCGIDHIEIRPDPDYGATRCFHIIRPDGSSSDVSYQKCIDGERYRQLFRPALRTAITASNPTVQASSFCYWSSEMPLYERTSHTRNLPR
jgi:hypothetical protein